MYIVAFIRVHLKIIFTSPFRRAARSQRGPPPPAGSPSLWCAGAQTRGSTCRNTHQEHECICCSWSASWLRGSASSEPASYPDPRTPERGNRQRRDEVENWAPLINMRNTVGADLPEQYQEWLKWQGQRSHHQEAIHWENSRQYFSYSS